jgi:predicted RNA-binding protein YlqC (UPF0109 family)
MPANVRHELIDLIRLLVDHPQSVEVTEKRRRHLLRFEVRVAPEDMGVLIGRQGRTVWALRELLEFRGAREGNSYGLEILD